MPRLESVPVGNSGTVPVPLDRDLLVRLRPEAARRNVSVARLIHDLLEVIATDRLAGAVLDDEGR
jgi:hypothetical protein